MDEWGTAVAAEGGFFHRCELPKAGAPDLTFDPYQTWFIV